MVNGKWILVTIKKLASRRQLKAFRKCVDMKVNNRAREVDSFIMCFTGKIDRIS